MRSQSFLILVKLWSFQNGTGLSHVSMRRVVGNAVLERNYVIESPGYKPLVSAILVCALYSTSIAVSMHSLCTSMTKKSMFLYMSTSDLVY